MNDATGNDPLEPTAEEQIALMEAMAARQKAKAHSGGNKESMTDAAKLLGERAQALGLIDAGMSADKDALYIVASAANKDVANTLRNEFLEYPCGILIEDERTEFSPDNWDLDGADEMKPPAKVSTTKNPTIEAALAAKDFIRERLQKDNKMVEIAHQELADLRWACYWFAHNKPGTPVPEDVGDALQAAMDSREERIMDEVYLDTETNS